MVLRLQAREGLQWKARKRSADLYRKARPVGTRPKKFNDFMPVKEALSFPQGEIFIEFQSFLLR
jgi:hypothetical protein